MEHLTIEANGVEEADTVDRSAVEILADVLSEAGFPHEGIRAAGLRIETQDTTHRRPRAGLPHEDEGLLAANRTVDCR
jgi:hypothetical protein